MDILKQITFNIQGTHYPNCTVLQKLKLLKITVFITGIYFTQLSVTKLIIWGQHFWKLNWWGLYLLSIILYGLSHVPCLLYEVESGMKHYYKKRNGKKHIKMSETSSIFLSQIYQVTYESLIGMLQGKYKNLSVIIHYHKVLQITGSQKR